MKGIILSGGLATRLRPLTIVTSKQLLPVYNRPMIYYPLNTLIKAGIEEILIIVSPDRAEEYLKLLGRGENFGVKISYAIQPEPKGLPEAFTIGEEFIGNQNVALILGDNIFEDDFSQAIKNFQNGAKIFIKKVKDPERYGVVQLDQLMKPLKIVEKPKEPIGDYAVTGLYLYDNRVIEAAKVLRPSLRGELEIVDLHNWYLAKKELEVEIIKGEWIDAGTFDSLLEAQILAKDKLQDKLII